jgi:hypothetical protein
MIMATGTVLSRILGFVRAVLLAAMIGVTTNAADAFGVANQLPNNVYAIIVGGVLNAVLVPQIIRARGQTDGGKGFIDRLLTLAIDSPLHQRMVSPTVGAGNGVCLLVHSATLLLWALLHAGRSAECSICIRPIYVGTGAKQCGQPYWYGHLHLDVRRRPNRRAHR